MPHRSTNDVHMKTSTNYQPPHCPTVSVILLLSVLGPNMLLSTWLLDVHISSLIVRVQVSRLYKTTGKSIVVGLFKPLHFKTDGMIKVSELNDKKHSQNLICSWLLRECNSDYN
jgi:hypothetical protein